MVGNIRDRFNWRSRKTRLISAAVICASGLAVNAGLLLAQVSSPNPTTTTEEVCKCAGNGEVPGKTEAPAPAQTVLNCGTSQSVNVSVTTPVAGGSAQEGSTGGTPDCATSYTEWDPYSDSPVASKTCNMYVKKNNAYQEIWTANGCQWNSGFLGFGGSWSCAPWNNEQVKNLGELDEPQSCGFTG